MTPAAFSLFGMEEQLENAFRFYRFSGEQEELREEMAGMGEISRRAVLDQYETMLKAQLLDLAAQEEVVLTDIELLLETDEKSGSYGSVLYVLARVSEGEEGQTTALIRRLCRPVEYAGGKHQFTQRPGRRKLWILKNNPRS